MQQVSYQIFSSKDLNPLPLFWRFFPLLPSAFIYRRVISMKTIVSLYVPAGRPDVTTHRSNRAADDWLPRYSKWRHKTASNVVIHVAGDLLCNTRDVLQSKLSIMCYHLSEFWWPAHSVAGLHVFPLEGPSTSPKSDFALCESLKCRARTAGRIGVCFWISKNKRKTWNAVSSPDYRPHEGSGNSRVPNAAICIFMHTLSILADLLTTEVSIWGQNAKSKAIPQPNQIKPN